MYNIKKINQSQPLSQHREAIGNNTNWHDKKQGDQGTQDARVKNIANQPGSHKDNKARTAAANLLIHMISSLGNSSDKPAILTQREGPLSADARIKYADSIFVPQGNQHSLRNDLQSEKNKHAKKEVKNEEYPSSKNLPLNFSTTEKLSEHTTDKTLPISKNGSLSNGLTVAGNFSGYVHAGQHKRITYTPSDNDHKVLPKNHLLGRHVPYRVKTTTQAPPLDGVKKVKRFDFSCVNDGEKLSFAQIIRRIGITMEHPISTLVSDIVNIVEWYGGRGCASQDKMKKINLVTNPLDQILSQTLSLLPNTNPVSILIYIVGPLLVQLANTLEGKPASVEENISLIQQVNQQFRAVTTKMTKMEQSLIESRTISDNQKSKVGLPSFHTENKVNHIWLEIDGKVTSVKFNVKNRKIFAEVPHKKGHPIRQEVYFSHLRNKWEMTGARKFNRFSVKERRLTRKFAIATHNDYSEINDKSNIYSMFNPFTKTNARLTAIELFGRPVPYFYDIKTKRHFIYNAAQINDPFYEVVLVEGEWHLKNPPDKKIKIESLHSPEYGKNLNVAFVKKKMGIPILAQVNSETGIFFGPEFIRTAENKLEPATKNAIRQQKIKTKGKNPHKKHGDEISSSREKPDILDGKEKSASLKSGVVTRREIEGSDYIHYYTKSKNKDAGSENLVISAHGGFIDSDTQKPVVILPSDITIKMLAPHGTYLEDPGLNDIVNSETELKSYITITEGKVVNVEFASQEGNEGWKNSDTYNPNDIINTLGNKDGLQNYRHFRYEGESDEHITNILTKNIEMANEGKSTLTDIITVNNKINDMSETDLNVASVQKIIDLDQSGKLLNSKGERYKNIIFSHCRNNFLTSADKTSTYCMESLTSNGANKLPKGSTISNVKVTILHRNDVNKKFNIKQTSLAFFIFRPVIKTSGTTSPSPD
ncbi:hypothetical protein SM114_07220 [Erwinia pyrifoliae]|uniref:putative adhesin n=1 Tax=Erwinia pyrifoliae TaxID=79967 RepID=UPI001CF1944C|nr:hypothetical protein [Erwinia pyrifoliae]MCA8877151.1 hypothetical protein [Erwinia pyrifoliae]